MRVGIISGYFNPIHTGHLDYIEGAREKCDTLYVIVNNDYQVELKGSKKFLDQGSRARIVKAIKGVHEAFASIDDGPSVVRSISKIHKEICDDPFVDNIMFMNGGDRHGDNTPESDLCNKIGIDLVYNVGGNKTQSSSILLQKIADEKQG